MPMCKQSPDDQYIMRLTPEEYDNFLNALDNPKPPSESLKRLMRRKPMWADAPIPCNLPPLTQWSLVEPSPAGQSRRKSLIETVTSTAIGFAVSLVLTAAVLPAFGYQTTWAHDFWITCIFTVASIV